MVKSEFKHYDLTLVEPSFISNLTDLIIDLDHLRRKKLGGSTHPKVFFQLKNIFHTLESIGSARIEGNNTTIAEYIDNEISDTPETHKSGIKEIKNIEYAMRFIEENVMNAPINRAFISELHKMVVHGLDFPPTGEGDRTPGEYRTGEILIKKSNHKPPDAIRVNEYMDELIAFIAKDDPAKYDLLKVAIAHHRFVWVHPFTNGNGRTVRLFTYAMLVKMGFNVNTGRILNPAAVFCSNRNDYYDKLAKADTGERENILAWIEYVLTGLKIEIEKIDKLTDSDYLKNEILIPSINYALEREHITELEAKILRKAADKQVIQASDIKDYFKGKHASEVSRQIKKLIDKKMLTPIYDNGRSYIIRFNNSYLLRGVIKMLGDKGFLPENEIDFSN